MALADLFNIPEDAAGMAQWSFAHMAHHRDTVLAAQTQKRVLLPLYILDPVDLADPLAFLNQHQTMHAALDSLYGIAGYDLTDVDWNDPGQRAGWIWLNAQLHRAEAQATGVY